MHDQLLPPCAASASSLGFLLSSQCSSLPPIMLEIPSAAPLSASKLVVEPTSSPKPIPDASTLVFGQTFTDHMLTCKWNIERGWDAPVISEYKDLAISPAATVLHYAPTLFEGLKVPLSSLCTLCNFLTVVPLCAGLQGQAGPDPPVPSGAEHGPGESLSVAAGLPHSVRLLLSTGKY